MAAAWWSTRKDRQKTRCKIEAWCWQRLGRKKHQWPYFVWWTPMWWRLFNLKEVFDYAYIWNRAGPGFSRGKTHEDRGVLHRRKPGCYFSTVRWIDHTGSDNIRSDIYHILGLKIKVSKLMEKDFIRRHIRHGIDLNERRKNPHSYSWIAKKPWAVIARTHDPWTVCQTLLRSLNSFLNLVFVCICIVCFIMGLHVLYNDSCPV